MFASKGLRGSTVNPAQQPDVMCLGRRALGFGSLLLATVVQTPWVSDETP